MQFKKFADNMLPAIFCILFLFSLYAFNYRNVHQLAELTMFKLNAAYRLDGSENQLNRYDLLISDEGFVRYRKYFHNGKQEYYSFNVLRFEDLDYIGKDSTGTLILRTQNEDVIVQTYQDPKGDIDSMARQVDFPVKDLEPEDLRVIRSNLLQMRKELQKN